MPQRHPRLNPREHCVTSTSICDVGLDHTKDALEWAKRASELGSDDDNRIYQGLLEANAVDTK